MDYKTKNYLELDNACSRFVQMGKFVIHSGGCDTPSASIWEMIRIVFAAIVCPRVDHIHVSDGYNDLSDCRDLNVVFTTGTRYAPQNWDHVSTLEMFVDRSKCSIWQSGRQTYVSLDSWIPEKWFKMISGITLLCPWVFADNSLSDEEKEFLKLISETDKTTFSAERFDELCKILYDRLGIENLIIQDVVKKLTKGNSERRITRAKNNLSDFRSRIEDYEKEIYNLLDKIQETTALLNGLYASQSKGSDEFLEFLQNSEITNFEVGEDYVYFTVYSLLSCYVEEQVNTYVLHNNNVLRGICTWDMREYVDMPYSEDEMRAFYKAVFIDHTFRIKLAARYCVSLNLRVSAQRTYGGLCTDRIDNPNIGYASCLGGYVSDLRAAAEAFDPVAVMSICKQSACSVNLGEVWPMARVTQDLVGSKGKVIQTDDGDITFTQAMEQIKANMNKE